MCFFHLNFLNARGILAQKIYNVHPIFCHFSDIKIVDDPNNQASFISCLLVNPSTPELAVLKKTNLIFQRISLSNATLFSIVFFACDVHKLNYIKNDFV